MRQRSSRRRPVSAAAVENLETRTFLDATIQQVPPPAVTAPMNARSVVVAPQDGPANVRVIDSLSGQVVQSYFAFDPGFLGGVRVAKGDVTRDGVPDVVVGTGPGSSHIKIFDGRDAGEIASFLAFPGVGGSPDDPTSTYFTEAFTGGVFVAVGDVNRDGFEDIIVSADAGGTPHVKVFSGRTAGILRSFFAYDVGYLGGVRVAAGDINSDGVADIITGAGAAAPHVAVFNGSDPSQLLASYFAYDPGFAHGIFVGTADLNDDGRDEILTSTSIGPSHVKAFDITDGFNPALVQSFFAYEGFEGGVHVTGNDFNGDRRDDIITGTGPGLATLKAFDATLGETDVLTPYENYLGGLWVAGD